MGTSKLNIVIPVFNEDKNFPNVHKAVKQHIKVDHTILVVYDFDEDTTVPVVKKLMAQDKSLKLVKNNLGRGPLNALKAGFDAAGTGPVLVIMADLSDDLTDVPKMLELYEQGNVIVCGSRYMKGGKQVGGPFIKRTLSRMGCLTLYWFRRVPTHDVTNNFKLYDGKFLHSIKIESTMGFAVAMEITIKAFIQGKPIAETPTTWLDRVEGEANFKLAKWLPQYMKWYFYAFQPKTK
jgi:dolichol-phosphate mannosyltransferase